jgi:tRNA(fMet)-specific endonuclease VapC
VRRRFLLDTNHLSAAINPVSPLRDRIAQEHRSGSVFRTIVPVLCELEIGIQDSSHEESYRRHLRHVLKKVKLLALTDETSRGYGAIFRELRRKGIVLSQVDLMVSAVSENHGFTILTSDRDFDAIPQVPKENWLLA